MQGVELGRHENIFEDTKLNGSNFDESLVPIKRTRVQKSCTSCGSSHEQLPIVSSPLLPEENCEKDPLNITDSDIRVSNLMSIPEDNERFFRRY